MKINKKKVDVLIIGGGTAGCFAAGRLGEKSALKILIAEKANIRRSGCLAAGVNALNAYLNPGQTPDSFVDYVRDDSEGIIREDLVYTIAQHLNQVTNKLEALGLTIQKDTEGNYVARGKRSIKINGENIKPILADYAIQHENVELMEKIQVIDYIVDQGRVYGAYGLDLNNGDLWMIESAYTICATGGASGIYRPNNPGKSRHKMWYSPFNTGAGYGMGIRAKAVMSGFEMRFIALRCKDTIAPTGTIAQGVKASQVNANGESYVKKYGKPTTSTRLYATVIENMAGRGPCYLKTQGIGESEEEELYKAYLNMAPSQTLHWLERGRGPSKENVEIEGTEPYIVGGHTASGYWIDTKRRTSLKGLYAVGDVAGGSPKKYVTGCLAEAQIAVDHILDIQKDALKKMSSQENDIEKTVSSLACQREIEEFFGHIYKKDKVRKREKKIGTLAFLRSLEEAMQKTMDQYAGGISQNYAYTSRRLDIGKNRIEELLDILMSYKYEDAKALSEAFSLRDRLQISLLVIEHLKARKETRWHMYQENEDYPKKNDKYLGYLNSVYDQGEVKLSLHPLVSRREIYEHTFSP